MSSGPSGNSFFLGVALVINRSRDGPAFVFHYPPHIRPAAVATAEASSDPSEALDLGDILLERLSQPAYRSVAGGSSGRGASGAQSHRHRYHDEHVMTESGSQIVPWEQVAGFPSRDLAGILTPARSYHKKLFQLSLDPLYCISCPVHVPESGRWKKAKKTSKSKAAKSVEDLQIGPQDSDPAMAKSVEMSKDETLAVDEEKRSSMTMFNLVFFLDPKQDDVKDWTSMLYSNIIKKINRAYRYSQQHSDFVWKESKRILLAKDKGREERLKMSDLWAEILQSSSLAASVRDIYEAGIQNKIATIHLETAAGMLSPSVQIPVPFYVADLPSEEDCEQRGLWLTTANAFFSQDALEEPGFLDRNFALLLMDDTKKIVAELQADRDPTTNSLIEFVRLSKPTMSFYQLGQSNVLSLGQVRKYAQHFIFWRRAIAIPPLHARDVYILSPNCDLTRLPHDSQEWQRAFPFAPPLPAFLAELSTSPRPYKSHCPSKSYRPLYLLMLAWLMRGGWVTQLCTFAYVVVWPEILYEVEYEMEAEELGSTAEPRASKETVSPTRSDDVSPTAEAKDDDGDVPPTTEHTAERARLERIALKAHRDAADKATAHGRKAQPVATPHPSVNDAPHLAGLAPHIILDAKKATGRESRYLSAVARRLGGGGGGGDGDDDKLGGAWQAMCRYFDGRSALERIALQEDMKRKEAWTLLTAMSEYLICVRHW